MPTFADMDMKRLKLCITMLAVVASGAATAMAQQNVGQPTDRITPAIGSDGSATFSIHAPKAENVTLKGNVPGAPAKMKPDGKGNWSLRLDSLPSDLYDYWIDVDGVRTLDPTNPYAARDIGLLSNIFIIPGGEGDLFLPSKTPHGTVRKDWYYSPTLKEARRLTVYTPSGYETGRSEYPVLYLLHGMGGDEEAWQDLGRAVQILDNMIGKGEVVPMIVVMPNGNAERVAAPGYAPGNHYMPEGKHSVAPQGAFEKEFPEIIKYVEDNYRVKSDKESRAIAGLSMGGGHAWRISMDYPDKFDYVGLFSPAVRWNGAGVDSEKGDARLLSKLRRQFQTRPRLYLIAIGSDDFLYDINESYRRLLDNQHISYEYLESKGGHTWANWRHYLVDFLPRLFKN